jgi:hypothetical protein
MTTIQELLGLRPVSGYKSTHGVDESVPIPNQLVGVELEIEQFPMEIERQFGGIAFTEDGSLRNGGIEAITKPIAVKHLGAFLTGFFDKFQIGESNYSDRTSTHVHFNVLPLTVEQVTTICLVYQTVENLLFRWVGNERDHNIYCVPWNQCNLNYDVVHRISISGAHAQDTFRRWQKYAALNLIPVAQQGTLEFRHLHGTCDVGTIMRWVSIISQIFLYTQKVGLDSAKAQILNMNTVSNYAAWMSDVFGKYASNLQFEGYEKVLSIGVVDSKLMLVNDGHKNVPYQPFVPMYVDEPREEEDTFDDDDRDRDLEEEMAPLLEPRRPIMRNNIAIGQPNFYGNVLVPPPPADWQMYGEVAAPNPLDAARARIANYQAEMAARPQQEPRPEVLHGRRPLVPRR